MQKRLVTEIVLKPCLGAGRNRRAALELLGGAIADQLIEEARLEVAQETGREPRARAVPIELPGTSLAADDDSGI